MGMAIPFGRGTVSSPSSVRDTDLGDELLGLVHFRCFDLLLESNYFANLLEVDDLAWLVTVNAETS